MSRITVTRHYIARRTPRHPRSWHFRRWCGHHSIPLSPYDLDIVEALEHQRQSTGYVRAVVGAMAPDHGTARVLSHYIAWLRHIWSDCYTTRRTLVCGPASVSRLASGLCGGTVRRATLRHPEDLRGCAFDIALLFHTHTAGFTPLFCAVVPPMELVEGSVLIIQGDPSAPSGFAAFLDRVARGLSASFIIASLPQESASPPVVVRCVIHLSACRFLLTTPLPLPHCFSPAPPVFVTYAAAAAAPQPLLTELSLVA